MTIGIEYLWRATVKSSRKLVYIFKYSSYISVKLDIYKFWAWIINEALG